VSMLSEIVEQLGDALAEQLGGVLGDDPASTEPAVDAAVPAVLAGLAGRVSHDPAAVFSAVTEADGSEAISQVAFGDGFDRVAAGIADHLGTTTENAHGVLDVTADSVGGFLSSRVAEEDLDAQGLAAALTVERADLETIGIGPVLAGWGLGPAEAHAGHGDGESGFAHAGDAGKPAGLWWLTSLITIALFAWALSQCGT
jgi:hypothetical protein